ncbi:M23 family metallopeptidase [Sulfurimonas sp.]|uniref:M23 family metallopeptidase n=1 Tax=Sulfurimonas sp. TaxID=2022749 RepID=UPI00260A9611|nr:M23 family metallopeptidase [Sulfurimonas sp.]
MRYLVVFCLLISSLSAFSVRVINDEVARGSTAFVELHATSHIKYLDIIFDKKKFPIFKHPMKKGYYFALVPISYYMRVGSKKMEIEYLNAGEKREHALRLDVLVGEYKKEQIKVSSKKVNPKAASVKKRIAKEYKEAMQIYNTVDKKSYISKKFILPLESNITSPFGTARVYNNSLKGYHSGTDFHAKMGTPIKAANDGRVVLARKRFYSGGTVIIDHGEGIYTCYFHLSSFKVKKGAFVKRSEIIALSGKSGRVTGPHLHFSARVDGVQVDPLQLITLLNNNLLKGKK